MLEKSWPNIVTITCLIIVASIEALEQAVSGAPNVAAKLPHLDGRVHYLPLLLLIAAGVSWFVGLRHKKPLPRSSEAAFHNPKWETITRHNFANEAVEVDGKRFVDCKFHNVKLVFHGKGPTEFLGNITIGGTIELTTDDLATMHYLTLENKLSSLPGAQTKRSAIDSKGNSVPNAFDLTAKALNNPLEGSKSLNNLPLYRQDLEISLLSVVAGTSIGKKATVFLEVKTWAKCDLNITKLVTHITIDDDKYDVAPIKDLSEWILVEEIIDQHNRKNHKDTNLGPLSLVKEIESGIFSEGHHQPKWVGCELPLEFITEEQIQGIKMLFHDKHGIASREMFRSWPKTSHRVIDADFRRPH